MQFWDSGHWSVAYLEPCCCCLCWQQINFTGCDDKAVAQGSLGLLLTLLQARQQFLQGCSGQGAIKVCHVHYTKNDSAPVLLQLDLPANLSGQVKAGQGTLALLTDNVTAGFMQHVDPQSVSSVLLSKFGSELDHL